MAVELTAVEAMEMFSLTVALTDMPVTATVAFIAETLLGMDTDDVKLDYNLTTLSFIAVRSWDENELIPRFFDAVAKETGKTDRQSSIRSLLLSLGVSEAEIEQFRSIMIE